MSTQERPLRKGIFAAILAADGKSDRAAAPVQERSIGNHVGRCGGKYVHIISRGILPA